MSRNPNDDELADLIGDLLGGIPRRRQRARPQGDIKFDGVRCGLHRAQFQNPPGTVLRGAMREKAVGEYVRQVTPLRLCMLPANHDGHCREIERNPELAL